MSVSNYAELKAHVGHTIVCVTYGSGENVALECEDCSEILMDYDRPAPKRKPKTKAAKPAKPRFWHSRPYGTFWELTRKIGWGTRTTDSKTVAKTLALSAAERERYGKALHMLHEQLSAAIDRMLHESGAAGRAAYRKLPFSSDDTYADMVDHAIGLGKTFYMKALKDPAILKDIEPEESYAYCFQKPGGF